MTGEEATDDVEGNNDAIEKLEVSSQSEATTSSICAFSDDRSKHSLLDLKIGDLDSTENVDTAGAGSVLFSSLLPVSRTSGALLRLSSSQLSSVHHWRPPQLKG